MDRRLHAERVDRHGRKVTYRARLDRLPSGTFVRIRGREVYVPFTTTILLSLALTALSRLL